MPDSSSNTAAAVAITAGCTFAVASVVKRLVGGKENSVQDSNLPAFLYDGRFEHVVQTLANNADNVSNDSLIKIIRQLEFWTKENLSPNELLELTERLVRAASWRKRGDAVQVPKVRFGKTELQIPIITCGSMRFQHTWMPDNIPVLGSNPKKAVNTPSQENLKHIVRQCLQIGINHFETARFYGTSEYQLMQVLSGMIESGEIKRSDFILQTKVMCQKDVKDFTKLFGQSWEIFQNLGHIDLFSIHLVSKADQLEWALTHCMDEVMKWKQEGKIRHVGFSTHGSSQIIMDAINSKKFDYVNLHYHFFGSYHAEGTSPDGTGETHGNLPCVERALELDMGVFCISPNDKGGRLYQPSATVARTIGPQLTPIAFANLHVWKTAGMHTASVGFARPEDLDEILEAAELFTKKESNELLQGAETRLLKLAEEKVGKEWFEKGMLNIPDFYDRNMEGVALGHILWIHNLVSMYGMYDTAKARYKNLIQTGQSWNPKKSFEENLSKMSGGNPGGVYRDSVDLKKAFSAHYNPEEAAAKVLECTAWFKDEKKTLSDDERRERGWEEAYDLRPWHEFPDTDRLNITGVLLQNMSGGLFGAGGGPTKESVSLGENIRTSLNKVKNL